MKKSMFIWMPGHSVKIIRVALVRFICEGFTYRASALTYTTLLALVPLMALLLFVLSIFPIFREVSERIQDLVFSSFVPEIGDVVKTYFVAFAHQASKLSTVGIALLVISAVMLLLTIERSFNEIWYVKIGRKGIGAFLTYWAVITLGPIFIGLSFLISSYVFSLRIISIHTSFPALFSVLPFLFLLAGFTLLNVIVPNCKVKIRHGLLGGCISAVLFECARHTFSLYAVHISGYHLIYGTLAAVPLFLVWVYVCWLIILMGALISHAAATETRDHQGMIISGFTHVFLLLEILWEGQQSGRDFSLKQIQHRLKGNFILSLEVVMQELLRIKLVKRTEEGRYFLSYNCDHLSLHDLIDHVPWHLPSAYQIEALKEPRLAEFLICLTQLETAQKPYTSLPLSQLFVGSLDK